MSNKRKRGKEEIAHKMSTSLQRCSRFRCVDRVINLRRHHRHFCGPQRGLENAMNIFPGLLAAIVIIILLQHHNR